MTEDQLWDALVTQVETEVAEKQRNLREYAFNRSRSDLFRISFVDTFLNVGRKTRAIRWNHVRKFEERGDNVRSVIGSGLMELTSDGYLLEGRRIDYKSAARHLIELLTENPSR